MIIVMEPKASENQIQAVVNYLESNGFKSVLNRGDIMTVIAAIGDRKLFQPQAVASYEGVREVKLISEPYKLASREGQPDDTVIEFDNGVKLGGKNRPQMMVGPCCVEKDIDGLLRVAEAAKECGCNILRGGAFKPRTSPYDFQGYEEKALEFLKIASEKTGMLVVTEVMDTLDLPLICRYADIIQIGARNMQNFKLLKAAGQTGKPVMIKNGPAATIREFLLAAEYVLSTGNPKVILCERGVKGFDSTYTRNTLDIAAIPVIKKYSHLPVIVDPSHGTGRRYLVESLAKAGLVVGANGVMMEVHHDPDRASSDGAQSLTIEQFKQTMKRLNRLMDIMEEESI